jgi:hypothetical protein
MAKSLASTSEFRFRKFEVSVSPWNKMNGRAITGAKNP